MPGTPLALAVRVSVAWFALMALGVPRVASADDATFATADDGYAGPPSASEHLYAGDGLFRPPLEWSTWLRGSYGVAHARPTVAARRIVGPVGSERHGVWELGAGIEASLALSRRGNVRLGGWLEARGASSSELFGGAELVVTRVPARIDLFLYEGHGILAVRAGRSSDRVTAAVGYGYVAPYWLEGPCRMRFYGIYTGVCSPRPERTARYMAGVRLVATATRALDDPRAWTATLGLEFEPVGALRMMTVARSWY